MEIEETNAINPYRKLKKSLILSIIEEIEQGATRKHAALAHGISPRTIQLWIQKGIQDLERGDDKSLRAYFVRQLFEIELKEIKTCRDQIRSFPDGHKGAEWTLKHVYWREFSANAMAMQNADDLEALLSAKNGEMKDDGETQEVDTKGNKAPRRTTQGAGRPKGAENPSQETSESIQELQSNPSEACQLS